MPAGLAGVFSIRGGTVLINTALATRLVGVIWRRSASLAFDAGFRAGGAAGQPLIEGRLGLTFAVDVLGRG
jgi:hypothetical protein